jgi:hypothetical protein
LIIGVIWEKGIIFYRLKVNNGCKLLYGDVANWISENNYKNEILLNEVR